MGTLRDHVLEVPGVTFAAMERAADEVGVRNGERADDSQLAAILARLYGWQIETPLSEVPVAPAAEGADAARGSASSATDAPSPDEHSPSQDGGPDAVSEQAPVSAQVPLVLSGEPAPPSMDEILAVTGGELIEEPPKRGRTTQEAIADAQTKAKKAQQ
jgi:hypothetical protein